MRVATWNIRAARSALLEEIGSELASMEPDIAALQEVDRRARRTGFRDQPAAIASALGFHYAFAASIRYDGGDYGLAVVSRWPIVDVRRHPLDDMEARELRIVLDVTVCARGRPLRVLNHHADTRTAARTTSLTTLSSLARARLGEGIVVLGDFNDVPDSPGVLALLGAGLVDLVGRYAPSTAEVDGRIDYLMTDPRLAATATAATVWQTAKSDHHALVADLAW
jgi:endonuclease/exonuclease/phosphatase family metal-dependent hydrolase